MKITVQHTAYACTGGKRLQKSNRIQHTNKRATETKLILTGGWHIDWEIAGRSL